MCNTTKNKNIQKCHVNCFFLNLHNIIRTYFGTHILLYCYLLDGYNQDYDLL